MTNEEKKEIELTPFESELFSTISEVLQRYLLGEEVNIAKVVKEHSEYLLKLAKEENSWISADENVTNAAEKTTREFCHVDLLNGDFLSLEEAQEPINELIKTIAIKSFILGSQWKEKRIMDNALYGEVTYGKSLAIPSLGYFLDTNRVDFGDKVKVIIIKSEESDGKKDN